MDEKEHIEILAQFEQDVLLPLAKEFGKHAAWTQAFTFPEFSRRVLDVCTAADNFLRTILNALPPDDILAAAGMLRIISRLNSALPHGCPYCICATETPGDIFMKYAAMRLDVAPELAHRIEEGNVLIVHLDNAAALRNAGVMESITDVPPPSFS